MGGPGVFHGVNGGVAIVAIPEKDDYVWRISSEKIPHLTLMVLGPLTDPARAIDYVEHSAATTLSKFMLSVDRRGLLGEKDADVLFFDKSMTGKISELRGYLLANETISTAYKLVEQYDEFTPHLTLGWPDAPAKKDPRDYPGINWVNFDRIAVWTGQYDGPEFYLTHENAILPTVEMSDGTGEFLEHYGIRGMRWGVRRDNPSGGSGRTHSDDAARAATAHAKLKQHGTKALSNEELRVLVDRMNLEAQFKRLEPPSGKQKAGKFVADLLVSVGKQQATKLATDIAAKQVGNLLKKAI